MVKLKLYSLADAAALLGSEEVNAHLGLPGIEAVVIFENRQKQSTDFGKRTMVAVGEASTHKTVAEFKGAWLGDSLTRQDAIGFFLTANT